jgi:hypothetical protein
MNTEKHNSFYRCDPITLLFRAFLRLPSWGATIVFFLFVNVPIVIASLVEGMMFTHNQRIGLLVDYGYWVFQLGTFPATFYAFMWLPDGVANVINGLKKNKVIVVQDSDNQDKSLEAFMSRFLKAYSHIAWILLSIAIISVFMGFLWTPQQKTFYTWQTSSLFIFWYSQVVWFLIYLIGFLLFFRGILTIYWLNYLFKEYKINIKVLHPDGAGGLSPLGKFSVNIGYILAIYGIGNVMGNLSAARITGQDFLSRMTSDPTSVVIWIIYFILAPILFFLPLGVAHSAMRLAKSEYLEGISDRFNIEIERIQSVLDSGANHLKESIEKIEQIKRLHDIASRFPVWPFNTSNLVRFFSSILSPLVVSLFSVLIKLILK